MFGIKTIETEKEKVDIVFIDQFVSNEPTMEASDGPMDRTIPEGGLQIKPMVSTIQLGSEPVNKEETIIDNLNVYAEGYAKFIQLPTDDLEFTQILEFHKHVLSNHSRYPLTDIIIPSNLSEERLEMINEFNIDNKYNIH